MKKIKTTLVIVIILFSNICFSQNEINIGVNVGATLSEFRGNELIDKSNPNISFLLGVSFEYFLNENLSLKSNLNYERKSFSNKSNFTDEFGLPISKIKVNSNYDYLVLPVLIKYVISNSNNLFINGGPFIGYLLNTKSTSKEYSSENFTHLNKKIDIGLSFGVGKKIYNNINIELRGNLGLLNTSNVEVFRDGTIKTNSLSLILNWDFEI